MQLSLADDLNDLSDEELITYNLMADSGDSLFHRYGLFDRLICDIIGGSIADGSAVLQPVVAIIVDLSDTACGGAGNFEVSMRSAGEAIRALSPDSVFFVVGFAEHARLPLLWQRQAARRSLD